LGLLLKKPGLWYITIPKITMGEFQGLPKTYETQSNAPSLPASAVFLGLANDKLNQYEAAEEAYLAATRIKGNDRIAWQGLINLYEKQGGSKLDVYHDAVLKLGKIFADRYEMTNFQIALDIGPILTLSVSPATRRNDARMLLTNTQSWLGRTTTNPNTRRPSNCNSLAHHSTPSLKVGYHTHP
jgi:tetratricopeptide (TPR) repeat protein